MRQEFSSPTSGRKILTNVRYHRPHLSADRVVVPLGVCFGPAFRVTLDFCPRARFGACLVPVRRPTPPVTSFRPGFGAGATRFFFGWVPVVFGLFPPSPPWFISPPAQRFRAFSFQLGPAISPPVKLDISC